MTCTFVAKRSINGEIAPQNLILVNVVGDACWMAFSHLCVCHTAELSCAEHCHRNLCWWKSGRRKFRSHRNCFQIISQCLCVCARCSHTTTWSQYILGRQNAYLVLSNGHIAVNPPSSELMSWDFIGYCAFVKVFACYGCSLGRSFVQWSSWLLFFCVVFFFFSFIF